ncbi:MAG: hypothetical protein HFE47_04450 [Clostridia bacterium]|nr:hypothetical protein [Clostridia bacterium]
MPEIVELKIFAQSIKDRLLNKTVFRARNYKNTFDLQALAGKKLTDIRAHGKEMFFCADGAPAFSVHLMLHGGFNILNENLRPAAVDLIGEWQFESGEYLILYDTDGYAKIAPFTELPDVPEATEITESRFYELLARKKGAAIKNILCDQKCVRGIGNAYADEILYAAKIHPAVKAGRLPDETKKELYTQMRNVLHEALNEYGKKYRGALSGEMRDLVRVHTKAGITPDGEYIKTCEVGGKKTYYTLSQRQFD